MKKFAFVAAVLVLSTLPILAARPGGSDGAGAVAARSAPESVVNRTVGLPDWTARNVEALRGEIVERLADWPSSDPELVGALGNFLGQARVRGIDVSDLIDLGDPGLVTPELDEAVLGYLHFFESWRASRAGGEARSTPSGEYSKESFPVGMTYLSGATVIFDGGVDIYNDESVDVPIGFGFKFYQGDNPTYWDQVRIGTNGYLTFFQAGIGALDGTDHTNDPITDSYYHPNAFIAPWWDDMIIQVQGTTDEIAYLTEGVSPNRVFTAEWFSVSHFGGSTSEYHYYQVKLYELTNQIELHYGTTWVPDTNDSATMGMEDYSATDGDCGPNCGSLNDAAPTENYRFTPPAGDVLVIRTTDVDGSVHQILTDLGLSFDSIDIETWTGIDFTPYDRVILALDGGFMTTSDLAAIRTEVIDQGKCVLILGGSSWADYHTGLNDHLVESSGLGGWSVCTTSPHLDVVDPSHPLALDLPDPHDFTTPNCTWHFLDVTDPEMRPAAENCNGYELLFSKSYPATSGQLACYQTTPQATYWSDPADQAILSQVIENALSLCDQGPPRKSCSVLLLATEPELYLGNAESALVGTGLFDYGDIDVYDAQSGSLPSLSELQAYAAVMTWTDVIPADPAALGDLLKAYVDEGGGLVLATFGFHQTFGISGGILDPGYSPFLPAATTPVSGSLDPTSVSSPDHPFFQDVDLDDVEYWTSSNYVNPALNGGGLLLAEDTLGNRLVAVNPTGRVAAVEIYPGLATSGSYKDDTKRMLANMLKYVGRCDEDILVLSQPCSLFSAEYFPTALDNLGLSHVLVEDPREFTGRIGSGQDWSLVIVDMYPLVLDAASILDLQQYIAAGGRCILAYGEIGSGLAASFGAAFGSSFDDPLDIHRWSPTHPLLTFPNQVPDLTGPSDPCVTDGATYDPAGGGLAVCGYSVHPALGQSAVIVGNSGRTVLLGEIIGIFADDNDTDGKADALELAENAIVLVLTDPPVVPTADPSGLGLLALALGALMARRRRNRG